MNPAEFIDWMSTESVWLRMAVICPFMVIVIVGGIFFIVIVAGDKSNG